MKAKAYVSVAVLRREIWREVRRDRNREFPSKDYQDGLIVVADMLSRHKKFFPKGVTRAVPGS